MNALTQKQIALLHQEAQRRREAVAIDPARLQAASAAAFRRERRPATPLGWAIVALALVLLIVIL